MKKENMLFLFILALLAASSLAIIMKPTKLGLDLIGGSRLVLEAQTTPEVPEITQEVMSSLQYSIENRVNSMGVAETVVQTIGKDRLLIEIPNINDPQKAKEFLGKTANLEFKKEKEGFKKGEMLWVSTGVSGKDLKRAYVGSGTGGNWLVTFELNDQGSKKFAKVTTELLDKPLGIFFDGELVSSPIVRSPITGGSGVIEGVGTLQEVKDMVNLLNAGALPVPAKIIEENSIGPTLGLDSIEKSKIAGLLGLGLVIVFMLAYYRLPGLIANIALVFYGLFVFAIFKIIPVTLTLAGIAGFILSMGMAVDANILIFERTKEELRIGRTMFTAINAGFDRAFTSIFDSNMTTIITCVILYLLGTSIVKGFALTLAIGVLVSMFTAITVTRNFMRLFFGYSDTLNPAWFGLKPEEIGKAYKFDETNPRKAKLGVID
ncbi:MAG TPA: protein translocase subunit SecD [Candidatus Gastranaerophilales bacterium]|nr:protein translocase subunit SecD [Candidatus Gastranaerophilales bacterium]